MFKKIMITLALIWVATASWWLGSELSADALAIMIALAAGILAGIPTTLLLLSPRRTERPQKRPSVTRVYLVQPGQKRHVGAQGRGVVGGRGIMMLTRKEKHS